MPGASLAGTVVVPATTSKTVHVKMAGDAQGYRFAGVKPGVYRYYCAPHLALGMKAAATVQ